MSTIEPTVESTVESTDEPTVESTVEPGAFAEGSPLLRPSPHRDPFVRRWGRRLVSVSLYAALWAVLWALLPVLLPVGWVIDRVRGRPVLVRAFLMFALYLGIEVAGMRRSSCSSGRSTPPP